MSWWIARTDRTVSDIVPAAVDEVRAFYVDLDNIRLVHPLVIAVRSTERVDTADGYRQTYRVQDRIPLGKFTLRTNYQARLDVPKAGDVSTEARQFPRVCLRGTVSFDPVDGGTRITERIAIAAPRPLASVTVRQAVQAHAAMLAGIRRHFALPDHAS